MYNRRAMLSACYWATLYLPRMVRVSFTSRLPLVRMTSASHSNTTYRRLLVEDEFGNPMPLVDKQGKFVKEVTDFAGRYVKDYGQEEDRPVDADIAIKMKEENKLFLSEKLRALLSALLAYGSSGALLSIG